MRILIVEDEAHLAHALARTLRESGYSVDTAEDGEEGLYKARAWDYDAIVLDLMLPLRSGEAVLRELRRTKSTPVLLLTARGATEDRVRGLDAGADDYVVKPFELDELLARLRALIRRGAHHPAPTISVGEVEIDTATRTVLRRGEEIPLTAKEYAIVELLALHRGRIVTRAEIYEHTGDESEDTLSKVIEAHVSNIRKKLGRGFITTRRGHGYIVEGSA